LSTTGSGGCVAVGVVCVQGRGAWRGEEEASRSHAACNCCMRRFDRALDRGCMRRRPMRLHAHAKPMRMQSACASTPGPMQAASPAHRSRSQSPTPPPPPPPPTRPRRCAAPCRRRRGGSAPRGRSPQKGSPRAGPCCGLVSCGLEGLRGAAVFRFAEVRFGAHAQRLRWAPPAGGRAAVAGWIVGRVPEQRAKCSMLGARLRVIGRWLSRDHAAACSAARCCATLLRHHPRPTVLPTPPFAPSARLLIPDAPNCPFCELLRARGSYLKSWAATLRGSSGSIAVAMVACVFS